MQTILENRSFRKRFRTGELSTAEQQCKKLSAVFCVPGMRDKVLFFIDCAKVTPAEYKDELDRQNILFPYNKVEVFTAADELPDYCKKYLLTP